MGPDISFTALRKMDTCLSPNEEDTVSTEISTLLADCIFHANNPYATYTSIDRIFLKNKAIFKPVSKLIMMMMIIIIHKKKRNCKIVDFAVPADHRIKLKECKKKDKYLDLARKLKKTGDNYTNCNWCFWYSN